MTKNKEHDELMKDIAALGELALRRTVEEMESRLPEGHPDVYDEILFNYGGISEMQLAAAKPRWNHLHTVRQGLQEYLKRLEVNRENMLSPDSEEFREHEAKTIPAVKELIRRADAEIGKMTNNVNRYEPWDWEGRAERLLGEETAQA